MKPTYILLLLSAGLLVGSFAQRTSAQAPAEPVKATKVELRTNTNALDLAQLMYELKAPEVRVTALKDIFDKIDGRARSGDMSAAVTMYRLFQLQEERRNAKK